MKWGIFYSNSIWQNGLPKNHLCCDIELCTAGIYRAPKLLQIEQNNKLNMACHFFSNEESLDISNVPVIFFAQKYEMYCKLQIKT